MSYGNPFIAATDPMDWDEKSIEYVLGKIGERIAQDDGGSIATTKGLEGSTIAPTETVFTHGSDPLEGGTSVGKDPFKSFSQWVEVLPTEPDRCQCV